MATLHTRFVAGVLRFAALGALASAASAQCSSASVTPVTPQFGNPVRAAGQNPYWFLVADVSRNRLVVSLTNDAPWQTWEFDLFTGEWSNKGTTPILRPSYYDPVSKRTLNFGSQTPTWAWDGRQWAVASPTSPIGLNPSVTFHGGLGKLIRVGGTTGQPSCSTGGNTEVAYPDCWAWEGNGWSALPSLNIALKGGAALVYSPSLPGLMAVNRNRDCCGGHVCYSDQAFRNTGSGWVTQPSPPTISGGEITNWAFADPSTGMIYADKGERLYLWTGAAWVQQSSAGTGGPYPACQVGTRIYNVRLINDVITVVAIDLPVDPLPPASPRAATVGTGPLVLQTTSFGATPSTFQWRRNGVPLSDGGNISGSQTRALTIFPATCADFGTYDVVATRAGCTPGVTAVWTVTRLTGDLDGDNAVNFADLNALLSRFGFTGAPGETEGDVNGDGAVDFVDLNLLLGVYGAAC